MSKPNGILAMNPEKYREIDGVVFDLDSYARHCKPAPEERPSQTDEAPSAAPAPVFAVDPYPGRAGTRPRTAVRGAGHGRRAAPCESESDVIREENGVKTVVQTVYYAPGSGSGSGSYTTSYTTSFRSSGSGSGGSYVFGSCVYTVGGYGLELI